MPKINNIIACPICGRGVTRKGESFIIGMSLFYNHMRNDHDKIMSADEIMDMVFGKEDRNELIPYKGD